MAAIPGGFGGSDFPSGGGAELTPESELGFGPCGLVPRDVPSSGGLSRNFSVDFFALGRIPAPSLGVSPTLAAGFPFSPRVFGERRLPGFSGAEVSFERSTAPGIFFPGAPSPPTLGVALELSGFVKLVSGLFCAPERWDFSAGAAESSGFDGLSVDFGRVYFGLSAASGLLSPRSFSAFPSADVGISFPLLCGSPSTDFLDPAGPLAVVSDPGLVVSGLASSRAFVFALSFWGTTSPDAPWWVARGDSLVAGDALFPARAVPSEPFGSIALSEIGLVLSPPVRSLEVLSLESPGLDDSLTELCGSA